ncbi:E3 binding domain-containing protein [Streptomyces sp. NPDC001856]
MAVISPLVRRLARENGLSGGGVGGGRRRRCAGRPRR